VRKRQIAPNLPTELPSGEVWLDIDHIASVEVTSEEDDYPIESALTGADSPGWRAVKPGTQIIRLVFDEPQTLSHIWLVFEDIEQTRRQEFVLRWSQGMEHPFREIVRQEWNFSPQGSVREVEDYAVGLSDVMVLELTIVPDKSGGEARASLRSFRLA
jgi:hypothetical protein